MIQQVHQALGMYKSFCRSASSHGAQIHRWKVPKSHVIAEAVGPMFPDAPGAVGGALGLPVQPRREPCRQAGL